MALSYLLPFSKGRSGWGSSLEVISKTHPTSVLPSKEREEDDSTDKPKVMSFSRKKFILVLLSIGLFLPTASFAAAAKLEYSAWMPYWKKASSTADILPHLAAFSEVSPFSYTVRTDGTIADTAKITQEPWSSFLSVARAKK
ncbi:MAG: hypothetical protein WCT48_04135, partial [Candidatus Paceibacterota bacterium]